MSSLCCCWILPLGSDFSRCTKSEQLPHSQDSEKKEIARMMKCSCFCSIQTVHFENYTLSRFISVGFLVGWSTLISPSLEAVTLEIKILHLTRLIAEKLPDCQGLHVLRSLCRCARCWQSQSPDFVFSLKTQDKFFTSNASSVVSTRCRLPPLSPIQRQLPCPLMQIGKWLPGSGTCTQQIGDQRIQVFARTFFIFLPAARS